MKIPVDIQFFRKKLKQILQIGKKYPDNFTDFEKLVVKNRKKILKVMEETKYDEPENIERKYSSKKRPNSYQYLLKSPPWWFLFHWTMKVLNNLRTKIVPSGVPGSFVAPDVEGIRLVADAIFFFIFPTAQNLQSVLYPVLKSYHELGKQDTGTLVYRNNYYEIIDSGNDIPDDPETAYLIGRKMKKEHFLGSHYIYTVNKKAKRQKIPNPDYSKNARIKFVSGAVVK